MSSYSKSVNSVNDSLMSGLSDLAEAQTEAVTYVRELTASVLRNAAKVSVLPSFGGFAADLADDLQEIQSHTLNGWADFIAPAPKRAAKAAAAA